MDESFGNSHHLDVSKNSDTPKWMVYFMENPMENGMIWGYHYFRKHQDWFLNFGRFGSEDSKTNGLIRVKIRGLFVTPIFL